jgi:hypothetical protein
MMIIQFNVGDTIAFNGVSQNIADVMNASTNASRLVGMVNTKTVSKII